VGISDAGHSAISLGSLRVANPPAIARKISPASARKSLALLAVLGKTADRYVAEHDGPSVVAAFEHPSGCDAISVAHLFGDVDLQIFEDRLVEGDGFACAVVTVEGHVVDVIHEVGVIVALHAGEIA
jgi:hypothetical protein